MFKANIWHPVLESARDFVKSNRLRSGSAGLAQQNSDVTLNYL